MRVDDVAGNICQALHGGLHARRGVVGALVEVGVYHGKSFVPLALLRRPGELCLAIDCFERQEHNRDESGEGDRAAFEKNVAAAMRACCTADGGGAEDGKRDGAGDGEGGGAGEGEGAGDGGGNGAKDERTGRDGGWDEDEASGSGGGGGGGGGWLRVLQADSVSLPPGSVAAAVDGQLARLFSIDGCHTAAATRADLSLASACLHPMVGQCRLTL